jgi:hypothetical protein
VNTPSRLTGLPLPSHPPRQPPACLARASLDSPRVIVREVVPAVICFGGPQSRGQDPTHYPERL